MLVLLITAFSVFSYIKARHVSRNKRKEESKYQVDLDKFRTVILPEFERAMATWHEEQPRLVREWREECDRCRCQWENVKNELNESYESECRELRTPERVASLRRAARQHLTEMNLMPSDAMQGSCDRRLINHLRNRFPALSITSQRGVPIPGSSYIYTPDIIVEDRLVTGVTIDIEIDEPWYHNGEEPVAIHFFGKDDARNRFFKERNWIILRFYECQVYHHIDSCAKEVARVLDLYSMSEVYSQNFHDVQDLHSFPQWDKDSAVSIARCRCQRG